MPQGRQRQLPLDSTFYSALNAKGAPGSSWRTPPPTRGGSEMEIRKKLLEDRAVDVMISIGPNFFYTVTLPVYAVVLRPGQERRPTARTRCCSSTHGTSSARSTGRTGTSRPTDRVPREYRPALPRREAVETSQGSEADDRRKASRSGKYADVAGLCKVATLAEIEAQGWSLNPGRYVGVAERPPDEFEFAERLEELNEELETLNAEARDLEERIAENVSSLLLPK